MKTIKLTQDQVTIVDDEDYEKFSELKKNYVPYFLGRFVDKEKAHEAYMKACYDLHGKYANPN